MEKKDKSGESCGGRVCKLIQDQFEMQHHQRENVGGKEKILCRPCSYLVTLFLVPQRGMTWGKGLTGARTKIKGRKEKREIENERS